MSDKKKAGYYTIGRTPYIRSSLQLHYFQFTLKQLQSGFIWGNFNSILGICKLIRNTFNFYTCSILGTVADYKGFKNVFHILLWTRYRIYKYVSSRSNLSVVLIARVLYARFNRLCWSKYFL